MAYVLKGLALEKDLDEPKKKAEPRPSPSASPRTAEVLTPPPEL